MPWICRAFDSRQFCQNSGCFTGFNRDIVRCFDSPTEKNTKISVKFQCFSMKLKISMNSHSLMCFQDLSDLRFLLSIL